LRKQHFDLARFTDGVTPLGIIEPPDSNDWTPEQTETCERAFNGLLAGNDAQRVRARMLPSGAKWQPRAGDDPLIALDRFLLTVTVANEAKSQTQMCRKLDYGLMSPGYPRRSRTFSPERPKAIYGDGAVVHRLEDPLLRQNPALLHCELKKRWVKVAMKLISMRRPTTVSIAAST
jgi:hypothetical protein